MAAPLPLEERLQRLEARMTALEQLPGRMDRLDGRMESLDGRMNRLDGRMDSLDGRMDSLDGRMNRLERRIDEVAMELRTEMRAGDEAVREEMRTGHVMIVTALTEQIEESRRHTRVLFEETLSQLKIIQEGPRRRRRGESG